ncbi:hypothetical protein AgCh_035998 [Apium graveolens]
MARLRRTARKSVPGGPYRVEGFQLPEQVVQVMSELAPRKRLLNSSAEASGASPLGVFEFGKALEIGLMLQQLISKVHISLGMVLVPEVCFPYKVCDAFEVVGRNVMSTSNSVTTELVTYKLPGLGELGVQGIGISVGKLDLYVAAVGINAQGLCSSVVHEYFILPTR